MPLMITAVPSANPGNLVRFGADGGLWGGYETPVGEANPHYIVDNLWAKTGQYSYPLGSQYSQNTITPPLGTGYLQPFMFLRPARIVSVSFLCTSYTYTGYSGQICNSVYQAHPDTGYPTTKYADFSYAQPSNYPIVYPIPISSGYTNTVFPARTLFWMATWQQGSLVATLSARNISHVTPARLEALPTSAFTSNATGPGLLDTTSGWTALTGPASVAPAKPTTPAAAAMVPFLWVTAVNV